ncbi:Bax inhibitor-1/YccA family protein [Desulfovibrio mangrovi]|uniref:Bax inhibitor-1/YccA family protein n=1 Tax=Desulfovibrio mangrovi TaxID=2976983 RepID=UPI002245D27F|nr:Bax inhibitor-1/YccA family protein [Desulfovibrio mangrovi]UZP68869.1 Bax inhibitor-1/YccA family protein [Desulfovibrio mangrovi]
MLGRTVSTAGVRRGELVNAFMRGVYGWMTAGLGVTALTALAVASSETMLQLIFGNAMMTIMLFIGQIGLVMYLSARINKLSGSAATGLFLAYSALNGVTLSAILLVYAQSTIFNAFFTAAGMFAAMSIYGMTTKKDLTGMGQFMMMGLFGLIIASIINMFLGSGPMDMIISLIGVVIFAGLTAYDSQKLRYMGETMPLGDETAIRRGSILGALTLYLDFINLFLFLLRLFGGSRD